MRRLLFKHKDTATTPLANETKPAKQRIMDEHMRRTAMFIIEKKYNEGNNFRFIKDLQSYIDKHKKNPAYLNALVSEDHRSTILHLAIQLAVDANRFEVLDQLLSCDGVNLNEFSHSGESVLSLALNARSFVYSLEALKRLFSYHGNCKIDVNLKKADQPGPLVLAIDRRMFSCVKLLLQHGGHNKENLQEAFDFAFRNQCPETAWMILAADNQLICNLEHLYSAIARGYTETAIVCNILEQQGLAVNPADPELIKAIFTAVLANQTDVIKLLFDKGLTAGVNIFPWAVENNHVDIPDALISQPAFIANAMHSNGHNFLTWLIANKKLTTAYKILDLHPETDVNARTKDGNTALILAAGSDLRRMVERLTNWPGINLNVQNDLGNTALHRALAMDSLGIITTILMCQGIDVTLLNSLDQTPLIVATRYTSDCYSAPYFPRLAALSAAVINARDKNGKSALIWAILHKKIAMIGELLNIRNLDITHADNDNKTPLMHAVECGLTQVVADLLTRDNRNVEAQDNAGDTALIIAARLYDDAKMVQDLLEHGASITTRNNKGHDAEMTAKHTAIYRLFKRIRTTANGPMSLPQDRNVVALVPPSAPPMEAEEIANFERAVIQPPVNPFGVFAGANKILAENVADQNPEVQESAGVQASIVERHFL